jgi:hypothetical protein
MAKLITKFKYLKPTREKSAGGYAKYIATREGVEKIDDSKRHALVTVGQNDLIKRILRDFPDAKEMLEYEDYLQTPTFGNASEFITRAIEDNAYSLPNNKTYADYIATRPRAEHFGSHGLFTDDGVHVNLSKVSEELNLHGGNVWTAVISLRREDAERLGFNTGTRWRDMLRTQTEALATNLKIPMEDLKWFAAFHNESHHPHVHLIAYSTIENEGYLTHKGLMNLRSSFAKDIFAQDLQSAYENQTEQRDSIRTSSREIIVEIVARINTGKYDNPTVEKLLLQLAEKLSRTSGKKQYGYLKADVKNIIDGIVDELSKDERISALYDLWYEQKEEILKTYTQEMPPRIPLPQNKEFKSIKNAVIQEALNITAEHITLEDEIDTDIPTPEPFDEETEEPLSPTDDYAKLIAKAKKNKWDKYHLSKICLDDASEHCNIDEAVKWLIESAQDGYSIAQYKLGKMFLRGDGVQKDVPYAFRWLEEAEKQNNQYAQFLLGKTYLNGEDVPQYTEKAIALLKKSSEQGNKYAAYTLGKAYLDGDIIPQNFDEAIRLLTLSANKNFAPAEYVLGKLYYKGEIVPQGIPKALEYLERAAEKENAFAAYLAGKIRLTEKTVKDTHKAIKWLKQAAEGGNDYAEYALGKLYLYGKDVERDTKTAMRYLTAAAEHGNPYALQMLKSIKNNKNWSVAMGSFRLLGQLGRIFEDKLKDDKRGRIGTVDRKLKSAIDEKKQAHGQRLD